MPVKLAAGSVSRYSISSIAAEGFISDFHSAQIGLRWHFTWRTLRMNGADRVTGRGGFEKGLVSHMLITQHTGGLSLSYLLTTRTLQQQASPDPCTVHSLSVCFQLSCLMANSLTLLVVSLFDCLKFPVDFPLQDYLPAELPHQFARCLSAHILVSLF